jgi:hypothetical protein
MSFLPFLYDSRDLSPTHSQYCRLMWNHFAFDAIIGALRGASHIKLTLSTSAILIEEATFRTRSRLLFANGLDMSLLLQISSK